MTDLNTILRILRPELDLQGVDRLNRQFSKLLYMAVNELLYASPENEKMRIGYQDRDYLLIGEAVCKMLDDYKEEYWEPLDDSVRVKR